MALHCRGWATQGWCTSPRPRRGGARGSSTASSPPRYVSTVPAVVRYRLRPAAGPQRPHEGRWRPRCRRPVHPHAGSRGLSLGGCGQAVAAAGANRGQPIVHSAACAGLWLPPLHCATKPARRRCTCTGTGCGCGVLAWHARRCAGRAAESTAGNEEAGACCNVVPLHRGAVAPRLRCGGNATRCAAKHAWQRGAPPAAERRALVALRCTARRHVASRCNMPQRSTVRGSRFGCNGSVPKEIAAHRRRSSHSSSTWTSSLQT